MAAINPTSLLPAQALPPPPPVDSGLTPKSTHGSFSPLSGEKATNGSGDVDMDAEVGQIDA